MPSKVFARFHTVAIAFVTALVVNATARAQDTEDSGEEHGLDAVPKIGRIHDDLRRTEQSVSLYQRADDAYAQYAKWKKRFENDTHVEFSVAISILQQWGLPNGGSPALQIYAAPSFEWTLFKSRQWGSGSVQFAYNGVTPYPTKQDAADVQARLGLITPINDYPSRTTTFSQLTYTQASPDNKWLVAVGQYPLSNFDGNEYLNNQQRNFNNYLFAQNGSSTYPVTGLGTFVQFNATSTFQFAAGVQSANNADGTAPSAKGFSRDCCAWVGYAQWTPKFPRVGEAQYSFTYYETPTIASQAASRGWSVNAVQDLSATWSVFARANGASGFVTPIKNSYAIGVAINDPWKRAVSDQIALALGYAVAAAAPTNPPGARDEKVIEAYWSWTFFGGLLVTPSAQVIRDPALTPSKSTVSVLSLRATLTF